MFISSSFFWVQIKTNSCKKVILKHKHTQAHTMSLPQISIHYMSNNRTALFKSLNSKGLIKHLSNFSFLLLFSLTPHTLSTAFWTYFFPSFSSLLFFFFFLIFLFSLSLPHGFVDRPIFLYLTH